MTTLIVWIALTLSSDTGAQYAPVTFASEADCQAFAAQVPKGVGVTRCLPAKAIDRRT